MSKLVDANNKIEKTVVNGYKKIEDSVVGGYQKIENTFVDGYKKIEDKFVDTFLIKDNETTEEARSRIKEEQKKVNDMEE